MTKVVVTTSVILAAAILVGCDDKSATPPQAQPTPAQAQEPKTGEDKSIQKQITDAVDQGKAQVGQAVDQAKQMGDRAITDAKSATTRAIADAKASAISAANQAKSAGQQAIDDAKQTLATQINAITTTPAAGTTQPASPTQQMSGLDVQKTIDQAVAYVQQNKLDLADKTLKLVEDHRASVPAKYYPRIDTARAMINAAKQAQSVGFALPKL